MAWQLLAIVSVMASRSVTDKVSVAAFEVIGILVHQHPEIVTVPSFEETKEAFAKILSTDKFDSVEGFWQVACAALSEVLIAANDQSVNLEPLMQSLFLVAQSVEKDQQSNALQVLGMLIDASGESLPLEISEGILEIAIKAAEAGDPRAVFVLNQFTSGAPTVLAARADEVAELLLRNPPRLL